MRLDRVSPSNKTENAEALEGKSLSSRGPGPSGIAHRIRVPAGRLRSRVLPAIRTLRVGGEAKALPSDQSTCTVARPPEAPLISLSYMASADTRGILNRPRVTARHV